MQEWLGEIRCSAIALVIEALEPVFDAAMKSGLNLWDSAVVYGMGASEEILGTFTKKYPREDIVISTKFTPQIAISWAIVKGTTPSIGVTKVYQVEDAKKAVEIVLSAEDMEKIETVAADTGVDTMGGWENPMV